MTTNRLLAALLACLCSFDAIADNVIRTKAPISLASEREVPEITDPAEEPTPPPEPVARQSCLAILQAGEGASNGVYEITLNDSKQRVYCDMTTAGGGWTMVVAQFESDSVTNWNEGIQADYDPSLASRRGFSLNTIQIPFHTQTGFGQNLNPVALDYGRFIYSTGDIPVTNVAGLRTGEIFQVHRSQANYYSFHNVGGSLSTADATWANTLTFDATTYTFSWAFSPKGVTQANRGYAFNANRSSTSESFAWTVWVR